MRLQFYVHLGIGAKANPFSQFWPLLIPVWAGRRISPGRQHSCPKPPRKGALLIGPHTTRIANKIASDQITPRSCKVSLPPFYTHCLKLHPNHGMHNELCEIDVDTE